jgi:hypothetical protein
LVRADGAGRGRVSERSPGSREAEGEGGGGLYVTRSGRCTDLLVIWGAQNSKHVDQILPFPFWRMSVGRRRSPLGALKAPI